VPFARKERDARELRFAAWPSSKETPITPRDPGPAPGRAFEGEVLARAKSPRSKSRPGALAFGAFSHRGRSLGRIPSEGEQRVYTLWSLGLS
jgi:hypothetical protein